MVSATTRPLHRLLPRVAPPLVRWCARRDVRSGHIALDQTRVLEQLVRRHAGTELGLALGFPRLARFRGAALREAFRAEVPLHRYADLAPYLDRAARGEPDILFPGRPVALAQTSGTTAGEQAGERWIPQNRALLDHHARGATAALDRLLDDAGPAPFQGRLLMLGGSTSLSRNAWGVPAGDLSGIVVDRVPWYLEGLYEPGREIALESDWTRKVARIAERLAHADVTLVSGIPSWCLVLFDAVCRRRGVSRIRDAWPRLAAFVHGGVSIDPYLPLLREHLPGGCRLQEVYPASELFLAVGHRSWTLDQDRAPDLELLCRNGAVLEFLPEGESDPSRAVGPEDLADGAVYRVLATTPGGLPRYELGDLVEGRGPGMVRFAGRLRARVSVFGEHVEGARLAEALAHACAVTDSVATEWHVAPVLPTATDPRGAHEWWIEFARPPADPDAFARALDAFLRARVMDYDAHRVDDVQLLPPRLRPVSAGTFHRVLGAMGKLGGQHKIPVAWADRAWADRLSTHDTGASP